MTKLLIIVALLFTGCDLFKPKFKVDTCFEDNFLIVQILEVNDDSYDVNFISLFTSKRRIKHDVFENEIEKKGLIPESCKELEKRLGEK